MFLKVSKPIQIRGNELVVVGQKGAKKPEKLVQLRGPRASCGPSLLRTRFKSFFGPIVSFLDRPNPYDRNGEKDEKRHWYTHEGVISRKFALDVMGIIPELKSGDFLVLRQFGLSPALLNNDASPANVQTVLAGHMGHEKSPRWGLMGMIVLLEQMGKESKDAPDQYHRAVLEFFRYMRKRVDSYVRACRAVEQSGDASNITATNDDLFDPATGVPLRYLVHMIDGVVINFAYDTDFDARIFEIMSLEWARIPNSMGSQYAPKLFADLDSGSDTAFGRNVARRLRILSTDTSDTIGRQWMEAFNVADPNNAGSDGSFPPPTQ
jgi:hypothetical protein